MNVGPAFVLGLLSVIFGVMGFAMLADGNHRAAGFCFGLGLGLGAFSVVAAGH